MSHNYYPLSKLQKPLHSNCAVARCNGPMPFCSIPYQSYLKGSYSVEAKKSSPCIGPLPDMQITSLPAAPCGTRILFSKDVIIRCQHLTDQRRLSRRPHGETTCPCSCRCRFLALQRLGLNVEVVCGCDTCLSTNRLSSESEELCSTPLSSLQIIILARTFFFSIVVSDAPTVSFRYTTATRQLILQGKDFIVHKLDQSMPCSCQSPCLCAGLSACIKNVVDREWHFQKGGEMMTYLATPILRYTT